METQFMASIAVGLMVTAVLFLPLLIWQYRRWGRFDGLRLLWTAAGFVYAAAIVAFTVFPLPTFSADFCASRRSTLVLDPLRFPRELIELIQTKGLLSASSDWLIWELVLNIVLFVPFGVLARRVLEWPRTAVFIAAVGASLLIESTQYTGNWGFAPCPYRFADPTDLATNTCGALIGIGLERIAPRILSTKTHLESQKESARPITRARRLFGMVLDSWYLLIVAVLSGLGASLLYVLTQGGPGVSLTPAQLLVLEDWIFTGAWLGSIAFIVSSALIGNGASYGQRTVYLSPRPLNGRRWRLLLRALVVQGAIVTGFYLGYLTLFLGLLWAVVAVVSLAATPRGISCMLAGCEIGDSRTSNALPLLPRRQGGRSSHGKR